MKIERDSIGLLVTCRHLGIDFDRTVTPGRQGPPVDHTRLRAGFADGGGQITTAGARKVVAGSTYAEPLLHRLGASQIDSMDVNSYEDATIGHDLNKPLPAGLRARFSLVIDGKTLEHLFNYPAAPGNALELVRLWRALHHDRAGKRARWPWFLPGELSATAVRDQLVAQLPRGEEASIDSPPTLRGGLVLEADLDDAGRPAVDVALDVDA